MYKTITKEADGTILGWYPVMDSVGDHHMDCEEIEDYTTERNDNGTYLARHTTTNWCLGAYATDELALQAILERIQSMDKMHKDAEKIAEPLRKKIDLNERYKDFPVPPKKEKPLTPYLQRLRERTKDMHAKVEQWRMERNRKLQMSDRYEARLNH